MAPTDLSPQSDAEGNSDQIDRLNVAPEGESEDSHVGGSTMQRGTKPLTPRLPIDADTFEVRYEVQEEVGHGGMGRVERAYDRVLRREVAIKTIRHEALDPDQLELLIERFFREALTVAQLSHPNIVHVYDVRPTSRGPAIVMELVPGKSLAEVLHKERRNFSSAEVLSIIRQVCAALAYAHAKDVVHRDIKPGNILLMADDVVKVVDFGLALQQTGEPQDRITEGPAGSWAYMAPEQREDTHSVDRRADLYSLGITFVELLTGDPRRVDLVPPEFRAVLSKAMAIQREDRFQTAHEFRTALDQCLQGDSDSAQLTQLQASAPSPLSVVPPAVTVLPVSVDSADRVPLSAVTVQMQDGQCLQCGAINSIAESICHRCRAALVEPCLRCGSMVAVWRPCCPNCYTNQPELRRDLDARYAETRQRADAARVRFDYRTAVLLADELSKLTHPRFRTTADWATGFITAIDKEKVDWKDRFKRAYATAQELLGQRKPREARAELMAVPTEFHDWFAKFWLLPRIDAAERDLERNLQQQHQAHKAEVESQFSLLEQLETSQEYRTAINVAKSLIATLSSPEYIANEDYAGALERANAEWEQLELEYLSQTLTTIEELRLEHRHLEAIPLAESLTQLSSASALPHVSLAEQTMIGLQEEWLAFEHWRDEMAEWGREALQEHEYQSVLAELTQIPEPLRNEVIDGLLLRALDAQSLAQEVTQAASVVEPMPLLPIPESVDLSTIVPSIELVREFLRQGQWELAAALLRDRAEIREHPEAEATRDQARFFAELLARKHESDGEMDECLQIVEKMDALGLSMKRSPEFAETARRCNELRQLKQWLTEHKPRSLKSSTDRTTALQHLQRLLELNPAGDEAAKWKRNVEFLKRQLSLGLVAQAKTLFETAAERDAARVKQALTLIADALRLWPQNAAAYRFRGRLQSNPQNAHRDYSMAIKLDKRDSSGWRLRGELRVKRRLDLNKALRDLDNAVVLATNDRDQARARAARAQAHFLRRNYPAAMEDLTVCVRLADAPKHFEHRGDVFQMTGQWKAAIADYREAETRYLKLGRREAARAIAQKIATCEDVLRSGRS